MKKLKNSIAKCALLAIMTLLCSIGAYAQSVITGTVVDTDNEPLPGVSVLIKGSNKSVVTDIDGKYSISAKKGDVIIFRFIGMKQVEEKVNGSSINVTMSDDIGNLDEVVVVGYGTQRKASITGAIATVNDTELLKSPTMSMSNVVGARVSGVAAVQSTGQPGYDGASITMRGQGNIIYVIDGVRRTSSDFNNIDPNEIESISVLKDASAVAVYGLDANGAFIVTTKRGSAGKTQISYSGSAGFSENAVKQEWLDGPGFAYWYNKALTLNGKEAKFSEAQVQKMIDGVDGWGNTDWYAKMYGTGFRTHHNLSATGGNDRMSYFASIGYFKEDGNLDGYNYDRYNLRANINSKITSNLTFDLGVSGRIENRQSPAFGTGKDDFLNIPQQIVSMYPFLPMTAIADNGKEYSTGAQGWTPDNNAMGAIHESGYSRDRTAFVSANMTLRYDAPFLKGLTLKFLGGYDMSYTFTKYLRYPFQHLLANIDDINLDTDKMPYKLVDAHQGYNSIMLNEAASNSWTIIT